MCWGEGRWLTDACDSESFQYNVPPCAIRDVTPREGAQGYAKPLDALYEPHQGIALPFQIVDVIAARACNIKSSPSISLA